MTKEKNNNEQMILETAERLFLEKGFAMTSTTEIAREVGCNQAMVHYYFRTKEKLFQAIFEKNAKLFITTLFQLSNEKISFEEKLKKIIEEHFEIIRKNPKLPFLFFNEINTNPQRMEFLAKENSITNSMLSQFNKELQVEIEKGAIRQTNALDLMLSMISLNMILFISRPIFKLALKISDLEFEEIIENRKKENVLIILRSLRP
ncbi:MAG TPA: TetR/AcrR family transcriptional regulator [Methanofastidiosum sp.]|nr:TetR/AcrR family transcriptional regulator [Methanofastidiosum sp.]